MSSSSWASAKVSKEHQIMAGFLLQLASFAQWPAPQQKHFDICIYGPDPFLGYIDSMVKRRPKNRAGQLIVIRRSAAQTQNLNECKILFTQPSHIEELWQHIGAKHHSLLVSHSEDFIAQGGMVNFAIINKRIKLEVNLPAVKQADIKLSADLLKHAHVISGKTYQDIMLKASP